MNSRRSNLLKFLAISVFTAFVYACAVGPKYQRPDISSPDRFRKDTLAEVDSLLNLKWWELFNDPTLDSLIDKALANNFDIQIAASRVQQSQAYLGINRADYWPQIQIASGIAKGNFGGGFLIFEDPIEAFNATGQLSWELDFWGRVRRSNEAARAELLASEFSMREVQISVITEVARTYFSLLDFTMRKAIAERTYASRDSGHKIIVARFESGLVPEIDVNQSEIQLAISAAAIPYYERQIVKAENNMSVLLGQIPKGIQFNQSLFDQKVDPNIPPGIPSSILDRRPDILAAESKLHAQTARIGIAQASRLPRISLTSTVGTVSRDLSNLVNGSLGWNVGGSLLGPLFEWGKNKRRVDVEREKTMQAISEYEKSVLVAFSEVEAALTNIKTLQEELQAREIQFLAASNAEYLAFERYNGGVTSYLEVLENQRSSFEAELIYAKTYTKYLHAHVGLYKALGGGWISEEEMKASQESTPEEVE